MTVKHNGVENSVGHFGDGTGARGIIDEVKTATWLAQALHSVLKGYGIRTSYYKDTISKSQAENLNRLKNYHNQDVDDLVISHHLNANVRTSKAMGVEVLYVNSAMKPLAEKLSKAIATAFGLPNRGAKYRNNLAILNGTVEPAILIEWLFVDSEADVKAYNTYRQKTVDAAGAVLADYFGVKKPAPKPTGNKPANTSGFITKKPKTVKALVDFHEYDDLEFKKSIKKYPKGTVITIKDVEYTKSGTPRLRTKSGTLISANLKYMKPSY